MTSILLANFHSFYNAGDAALLAVSLRQLREAIPKVSVTIIANYPQESGFSMLGVKVVPSPEAVLRGRGKWTELMTAYKQADALMSVPGNPFFSMGRVGWTLAASAAQLWLAERNGLPCYTLAQTFGPFRRRWERWLMQAVLGKAKQIWVRDNASLELLQRWGMTRAQYAPDAVFDFPVGEYSIKSRPSGFQLGVSVIPEMVRNLPDLKEYYRMLGEALTWLIRHEKTQVTFFGQCCGPTRREDDRLAAHAVVSNMPVDVRHAVTIDEGIFSPQELLRRYQEMDTMVAWRLHTGLLAAVGGVPTVWLSYLNKTEGVLKTLGWQDNLLLMEQLTASSLKSSLIHMLSRSHASREKFNSQLEKLRADARLPVHRIAAELNKGVR